AGTYIDAARRLAEENDTRTPIELTREDQLLLVTAGHRPTTDIGIGGTHVEIPHQFVDPPTILGGHRRPHPGEPALRPARRSHGFGCRGIERHGIAVPILGD